MKRPLNSRNLVRIIILNLIQTKLDLEVFLLFLQQNISDLVKKSKTILWLQIRVDDKSINWQKVINFKED